MERALEANVTRGMRSSASVSGGSRPMKGDLARSRVLQIASFLLREKGKESEGLFLRQMSSMSNS